MLIWLILNSRVDFAAAEQLVSSGTSEGETRYNNTDNERSEPKKITSKAEK